MTSHYEPDGERSGVIERWNEIDARDPLPSINDIASSVGIEPPCSQPGDRFERDQVDVAMYWPAPVHREKGKG